MSSPLSDLVDQVFNRLALVYGSRFTSHWPGDRVAEAKQAWQHELREFVANDGAIRYGLDHLPSGNPPMALEFRDLCRTYVRVTNATTAKPSAPVTAEERERAVAILRSFRKPDPQGPKAWAYRLRDREASGERLTRFQRQCWREALAFESSASPTEPDSHYESTT